MKILIAEDEPKTGAYLKQGLSEAGFVVDLARDGVDALYCGTTGDYDLVVLDVMLPGLDGWRVLQGLRKTGKDMPVLSSSGPTTISPRRRARCCARRLFAPVLSLDLDQFGRPRQCEHRDKCGVSRCQWKRG